MTGNNVHQGRAVSNCCQVASLDLQELQGNLVHPRFRLRTAVRQYEHMKAPVCRLSRSGRYTNPSRDTNKNDLVNALSPKPVLKLSGVEGTSPNFVNDGFTRFW